MAFTTQSVPFSWRKTHRLQQLLAGRVNGTLAGATPASTSRPSGEWNDDDFDVLADGVCGRPDHEGGVHGYAATREAAMAAFVKSWRGVRHF